MDSSPGPDATQKIRWALERRAAAAAERFGERTWIPLDYPPSALDVPRYGRGRPPHARLAAVLNRHRAEYGEALALIERHAEDLRQIDHEPGAESEPYWRQSWTAGMDAAPLYCFVRATEPRRYVEIGSGHSTLFAARAKRDGGLGTQIMSIDPNPRAEVDAVCDEVVREPFETTDPALFDALEPGDVVFVDSSHRVFPNSDVTAFFLDVLPEVPPGVLVGLHDIFLPDDYPAEWADRRYSEQYMLAVWLLAAGDSVRVRLASHFLAVVPDLRAQLEATWARVGLDGVLGYGSSFWFEKR